MGDENDPTQINLLNSFLIDKPTKDNPFFLKRLNSRTHYIIWWDDVGEYCYVHKSKGKKTVIDIASMIIEDDVKQYIEFYIKKEYILYNDIKLHFSGKMIE